MTWAPTTPEVDPGGGAGGGVGWPPPGEPPRTPRQNWRLAIVIVAIVLWLRADLQDTP